MWFYSDFALEMGVCECVLVVRNLIMSEHIVMYKVSCTQAHFATASQSQNDVSTMGNGGGYDIGGWVIEEPMIKRLKEQKEHAQERTNKNSMREK